MTLTITIVLIACSGESRDSESIKNKSIVSATKGKVKLMIIDPGHFHAALVKKNMYEQVDTVVYVYAPDGPELKEYLNFIESYNKREDNPTFWKTKIYTGADYLEKLLDEKPGNVMVTSGNNAKKTDYILKAVEAGINVLSDKPMVIIPSEFSKLEQAFHVAEEKGVLIYDIMTNRYSITNILLKKLSEMPEVFGTLQKGTPEEPAIFKESVHHFFKSVSGSPLKRPAWFFDVEQQGEGIVDVTTHLVDLIQFEAFPDVPLEKEDVEIVSARRWSTELTPEMFEQVTHLKEYPNYLQKYVKNGILKVYSNGEINYKLKGIHAKVSVIWDFEAPENTGDTHYSIMRGSRCNLIVKQGEEEGYKPTLYVEAVIDEGLEAFSQNLDYVINQELNRIYPDLRLKKIKNKLWKIDIPDKYELGHESHFGQVTEKFLQYLGSGYIPKWEIPNMIVKYYTTIEGMKVAVIDD